MIVSTTLSAMDTPLEDFLASHRIHEVECVIPDMTGIARGKIMPVSYTHLTLPTKRIV